MPPRRKSSPEIYCQGCLTHEKPKQTLTLNECGCDYCPECLKDMFQLAMKDEGAFPPRCCSGGITLEEAKSHLPKPLADEYNSRLEEMSTKNKVYCANNLCNCFIASHSIQNNHAYCQKCQRVTCAKCKEPGHSGTCTFEAHKALAALAKEENWQTCPDCRRVVEKSEGCNQVMCRCRCEFCYGCGGHLDKCRCKGTDDI